MANPAFSTKTPHLQLAWDSTSLKSFMMCPRKYWYEIINGWRSSGVDLEFGILAQRGFETYEKERLLGKTREEAQLAAVKLVMLESGEYVEDQWVPWGGQYITKWRCTGTEPYRNQKGNRAKCPYSHAGRWFVTEPPSICGCCGSDIETARKYDPPHKAKNRHTLVRLITWYCEEQPDSLDLGLAPYVFPDGTPAVELNVRAPLPFKTQDGESYLLTANLDSIKRFGTERFIADHKTTGKTPGKAYFAGYSPDCQVDTYDLIGNVIFPDLKLRGVMIEAAQCMVGGNRFAIHAAYRTDELREEYLTDLEWTLKLAEKCARESYWPKQTHNCWLCSFKKVCSAAPERRQGILEAEFENRQWNPLEER